MYRIFLVCWGKKSVNERKFSFFFKENYKRKGKRGRKSSYNCRKKREKHVTTFTLTAENVIKIKQKCQ